MEIDYAEWSRHKLADDTDTARKVAAAPRSEPDVETCPFDYGCEKGAGEGSCEFRGGCSFGN